MTHSSRMIRLKSGKDISDIGDSTNNPLVNTTTDDTEQHDKSVSGVPTGSYGQEIKIIDTTATATAIEGSDTRTIFANGMKEVSNSLALISATLQKINASFTKMDESMK